MNTKNINSETLSKDTVNTLIGIINGAVSFIAKKFKECAASGDPEEEKKIFIKKCSETPEEEKPQIKDLICRTISGMKLLDSLDPAELKKQTSSSLETVLCALVKMLGDDVTEDQDFVDQLTKQDASKYILRVTEHLKKGFDPKPLVQ